MPPLARINLCRTRPLGRRQYICNPCGEKVRLYNSCGERHCPLCGGGLRDDWLQRIAAMIVPGTLYLQIVFTVAAEIGDIIRINPRLGYNLLMRAAWKELKVLQKRLGIRAAALVVLHTWNQQLGHHAHIHALIPAGGVSLDGTTWVRIDQDPSLAPGTNRELGRSFRSTIIRRLRRLHKRGLLQGSDPLPPDKAFSEWLDTIAPNGFRVFVQPPPDTSTKPEVILKYLARYISGGPISASRLVSHENGEVTFMARPGAAGSDRLAGIDENKQVPVTIPEEEFVRRWSMHILPKNFIRVRHFGQSSPRNYKAWLEKCKELLEWGEHPCLPSGDDPTPEVDGDSPETRPADEAPEKQLATHHCPKCGRQMECIEYSERPSWRETLTGKYRPQWYS